MDSKKYFKQLINELLTVKVTRGEPGSEEEVLTLKDLPADLEDRLVWAIDKVAAPKVEREKYKVTSPKGKQVFAPDLRLTQKSLASYQEVFDVFNEYAGGTLDEKRLLRVVEPWGQVGLNALRKIMYVLKKVNKRLDPNDYIAFPFFQYANSVSAGSTILIPQTPVLPPDLIKDLIETKVDREGLGEFLLAILADGVIGSGIADLNFGSAGLWEMKDLTYSEARLGDASSKIFLQNMQEWLDKDKKRAKLGINFSSLTDLFSKIGLDKYISYGNFRNGVSDIERSGEITAEQRKAIATAIDAAMQESIAHEGKVAGIVGYMGDRFVFYPPTDFTVSRLIPPARLAVKLKV